ncbi:MAG: YqeG family HAD IIIA-type phosphatase [Oscillospiraceae bacterium]|nr:YqeG family HAD IIIA-type phosphatase [Oscillospiraceae bacterium]
MALFTPDIMLNKITDIDLSLFEKWGIKGVVLDIDNTLTLHDHPTPAEGVVQWLDNMKQNGIKFTVASNNTKERVAPFAQKLGVGFEARSCKPLTFGLTRACKHFGLKPREVAIIGDQIFTDILGGNLKGLKTILVVPFEHEKGPFFKLKRKLEKPIIYIYNRKHGGR